MRCAAYSVVCKSRESKSKREEAEDNGINYCTSGLCADNAICSTEMISRVSGDLTEVSCALGKANYFAGRKT